MSNAQAMKILYADDEEDIRTVASIALERIGGFCVRVCESGRSAISAATEFNPDCILLDVMMPGMDGPSTLRELRKIPVCSAIPAIFMTAKVNPIKVAQYDDLGVVGVIPKPFNPMTLSEELRRMLEPRP
ncbi:MAG: response regulator [Burkholderiales bacterium]